MIDLLRRSRGWRDPAAPAASAASARGPSLRDRNHHCNKKRNRTDKQVFHGSNPIRCKIRPEFNIAIAGTRVPLLFHLNFDAGKLNKVSAN
jgi:hypothetical protein